MQNPVVIPLDRQRFGHSFVEISIPAGPPVVGAHLDEVGRSRLRPVTAISAVVPSETGRHYRGLMRHLVLCQLVMLFLAEQTARLRGEKPRANARTNSAGAQRDLPLLAGPPLQTLPV